MNTLQQCHMHRRIKGSLHQKLFYQRCPAVRSLFFSSFLWRAIEKQTRKKAIKSWSSKTQLFQTATEQSIPPCSSWLKANVSHVWEWTLQQVTELWRTSRLPLQMQYPGLCPNQFGPKAAGAARRKAGMLRSAHLTSWQNPFTPLLTHRPNCWLLTPTCFWKPSRPPAAEHCWQKTHVSGISPLVQKALLAPGNPRAPNDPWASWEGSSGFTIP